MSNCDHVRAKKIQVKNYATVSYHYLPVLLFVSLREMLYNFLKFNFIILRLNLI